MLEVNFSNYNTYSTDCLTQWDTNQVLKITGLDMKVAPTILFSNRVSLTPEPVSASLLNGVVTCDIPNGLLTKSYPVTAYIRQTIDGTTTTIGKIKIPVIPSPEPEDYVFIENIELVTYESLLSIINSKVSKDIYENEVDEFNEKIDTLEARLENLLGLPEGSTTADAELIDIRVGADGTVYTSAGESVRKQIANIEDSLSKVSSLADETVNYNHIKLIEYDGVPAEDDNTTESTIINLFDKDTMVQNAYMNTSGTSRSIVSHSIAKMGIVPVEVGKKYSLSAVVDGESYLVIGATYKVGLLDSNKEILYSVFNASGTGQYGAGSMKKYVDGAWVNNPDTFIYRADDNGIGYTIEIPEGVSYIAIGLKNTAAATQDLTDYYMFEEGTACHDYVAYKSDKIENPDIGDSGNLTGCEIIKMFGGTLRDTYARNKVNALAQKVEGMTGLSDDAIIGNGLRKYGYRIEPAIDDIPTVYANGESFADMTTDKNEVVMSFKYISKTNAFAGWMKIKYQGNLSLWFDKKNFTVKLYGDKNLERKMKVDLRGWGLQNKFVWKANYIDRSHARNIVSARLWSDIVASRPTYDARMMYSPNHGAVDGFPFRLYVNGEYYGLMTWNIPKDGWMAEMTEDNANHCILCAEVNGTSGTSSCDFAAEYNSSAWSVEFPDEISNGLKYSFNDIINCVVNDTDEDFKANIDSHLDVYSAIDYYLYFYLNGGTDSLAKNMLLMTYDGKKWYCGAYDMDGVWGRDAESGAAMGTDFQCPEQYKNTNSLLWKRIEACFGQELHDRYFELRETILSKEYIMAKFEQFENQISEDMFTEDKTKNSGMKGVSGSEFLTELSTWLDGRFTYVDAEMELMVPVSE